MIKISLEKLKSADRPKEYFDEIYALGKTEGENLILPADAYIYLANKYRDIKPEKPRKSLYNSMKNWAKSGFKRVKMAELDRRLAICRGCEFWQENGNYSLGRCDKCGCTKYKLYLATESCPIGKWEAVEKTLE